MLPVASVVIPCHNRPDALRRAVNSVLGQTMRDLEVIVVDDASTDATGEVTFRDRRVRQVRHAVNRGPAAARNTGFAEARGAFVAVLDSDDEWLPRKLEAQIAALGKNAEACVCGYVEISEQGERQIIPDTGEDWRRRLHWRSEIAAGSTPLVRREFLGSRELDERLRLLEDWEWLLRIAQATEIVTVPEILVHKHEGDRRPDPDLAMRCTAIFLEKHDSDFGAEGWRYRRWVRAKHFERLSEICFRARQLRRGCAWLLRSYRENPLQNPVRLGALLAAPVDWFTGGSLIEDAAAIKNRIARSGSHRG